MHIKKPYKILLSIVLIIVVTIWLLGLNAGPNQKIQYGVTFSYPYAHNLGLDWKKVYTESLADLHLPLVRVPVYWNSVEVERGKYNFEDIDFQVNEASKYNAKVTLAIGKRLPRWPECHQPDWVGKLSVEEQQNALLSLVETIVERYYNNPAVATWQVENEAFLSSFGPCPKLDVAFFDKELALVKKLDPSRPILVTDSGELSSWVQAGNRGDIFGTTYYRYVYSDVLHRYWTNFYFPSWFYRAKAGFLRLLNPDKKVILAELEAEPWTTKGITNTPIEEQFKTMSLDKFDTITRLAGKTDFSPQYLWGVEWWYWMKEHGHPEFWEKAKQLINK
jgi:hypothetical protein